LTVRWPHREALNLTMMCERDRKSPDTRVFPS
jgi:hypothetical protein